MKVGDLFTGSAVFFLVLLSSLCKDEGVGLLPNPRIGFADPGDRPRFLKNFRERGFIRFPYLEDLLTG